MARAVLEVEIAGVEGTHVSLGLEVDVDFDAELARPTARGESWENLSAGAAGTCGAGFGRSLHSGGGFAARVAMAASAGRSGRGLEGAGEAVGF